MGAYAIRPYPDGRKGGVFFVLCRSGKGWLGGCALLLFVGRMKIGSVFLVSLPPFLVLTGGKETKEIQAPAGGIFFVRRCAGKGWFGGGGLLLFVGKMKIGGVFLVSLSPFLVLTQEKETKESQAPAGGVFFVRRRSGMGRFGGGGILLIVGKIKIGDVWLQIFLRGGERVDQYVPPLFFDGTMGAYAIRPYPDERKGGVFFVRRRSGKGWIGRDGLLLSIDIVWNGIRGLGDVGRDRK